MMKEFSFIIPVYKVEDCLERCVQSILEQDYDQTKIEIILVDDGSPDKSGEICDKLDLNFANVHAYHKTNGGLSDARNYGLNHATKEYIIFLDSDDYVSSNTCKNFNDILNIYGVPCDIVTGGVMKHIGNCKKEYNTYELPVGVLTGKEFLLNRLKIGKWYVAAWSSMYRREFLIDNNLEFLKGMLHEDEEFSPRAFLKANNVVCLKSVFYHYVIRENSITTSKNKIKNAKDIFAICNSLDEIYQKIDDKELRKLLMSHSAKICFRAIEEAKLYLKENEKFIDMNIIKKNSIFVKEKFKFFLLSISPMLLHKVCSK